MSEVTLSSRAYIKMMLHVAKYPHLALNGVLLASKEKSKNLIIVDAIPLFHQCLHVTPMSEIALLQIETMANAEDLQIAGYYSAAENFNDNTVHNAPGKKIAEKIAENMSSACFVVIDNRSVCLNMQHPAINVYQNSENRWISTKFTVDQTSTTLSAISTLLKRGAMKDIFDFDNHFDNTENDWTNSDFNIDLKKLLAMY